ncbi:MAG: aldehyde dehydrogenase family protein [Bacteroidota bacterium]|nr:aldehyde dehydrogenase family protein [Bacteroidota bacterium]
MSINTEIKRIYEVQSNPKNVLALRNSSHQDRIAKIKSIYSYILDKSNHDRIAEALYKDLRKSNEEVITTEMTPVILTIKEVCKKLKHWMKDEHVPSPVTMVGMSSFIKYESKGNILIIGPWNYPFQLAIYPLVYAIAAGNTAIIKPSEFSSNTANAISIMIKELFDENEVAVVEGGIPEATALLALPFNHIHFTGSPKVGKIVMEAAAKNLTAVTLELGGKSPVIIDGSTNLNSTAEKVCWGKTLNSGQTCIAPDFALVQENALDGFVEGFKRACEKFYDPDKKGIDQSKDYGRIINDTNFDRVQALLEDAKENGAKVEFGGEVNKQDRYIQPTLLSNINMEMKIMQDEIFGPILPVVSFKNKEDVTELLNSFPSPLALYIMSNNKDNTKYFLDHTVAGGTCINELMLTSVNPHLPFGGVNNSGVGKTGGKHSFMDFSNQRGVIKRKYGNSIKLIYPPFNKQIFKYFQKVIKF